ncbi:hypothetical protein DAPPUDRAFT_245893 [Daphnia pulex]|uniref:Uncharacterized protein n=1 Tax=Daphnia pulex TaxID=6669 RepID=E9GP89_DAPPU|nr:hypothetical protein DAPPUDRAFT_245893 [Daphnia pulex]|eukprot:EFX78600.1 hypothetical protein DAPPUDRAFT_245893 [Daphnia pulex]
MKSLQMQLKKYNALLPVMVWFHGEALLRAVEIWKLIFFVLATFFIETSSLKTRKPLGVMGSWISSRWQLRLFHRTIAQSGVTDCPWAIQHSVGEYTHFLADDLNCPNIKFSGVTGLYWPKRLWYRHVVGFGRKASSQLFEGGQSIEI